MRRGLVKFLLIAVTFFVGASIFSFLRLTGAGSLPLGIVAIGMFAGIRAIWKYNPKAKEVDLKKDD